MDWQALILTAKVAAWTTAILLIIGFPMAYWLAFTRWRLRFAAEALVALPLVLPPTVLGFYMLIAMGPNSPFGQAYESVSGKLLPFSFEGLVVASVIYSLPFAVQPMAAAFAKVDSSFIEASHCLGASRMRTFWKVILPQSIGGVVAGVVLSFAHTLGEFGVVLMVGGNIPNETRTVAISIYDEVQALNYDAAAQTSLFLLAVSFVVLALMYGLQLKAWTPWTMRS
ncbi:MAG: molybdate ABC transporter permease subunit [Bradymonadaceae bacterium]|nr:molybdate ABC transporter permease subunit [Lujinxingiaceae bacterium]